MKIAVIGSKGLPAKQGGIERHCEEIYPRLVAQGHSVDLFARYSYAQCCDRRPYRVKGVRVIPRGFDALTGSAFAALTTLGHRYDIVHFHAVGPALFSWLPAVFSTAKVVVTCHGLDWQRAKWGRLSSRVLHLGEQTAALFADHLIVVSEQLRQYFEQTYAVEATYISNGPGRFDPSDINAAYLRALGLEEGRYILFLGRFVPEKRPELLLQAFQSLNLKGWKLALVGGSSNTNSYTAEVMEMANQHPGVIFTGELLGTRLAEVVRGAGLFVLPSDIEGLPLAMLEAMQECVPILASNIPVHSQLTADGRGLLFEAGNPESCAQALKWAVSHPQNLASMARTARDYVLAHHNWERITEQTLSIYKHLLSNIQPEPVLVSASAEMLKQVSSSKS
jgi:glycosyltransferase involved in cell wall biosynthesis